MRIFNHDDTNFDTLGIGSLDETITLFVRQGLNGIYELEMEYPVTGRHYDSIKLRNIIMSKPDMYTNEQPFRIYSITKPINGVITILAEHISYDASGIVLLPKRSDDGSIESYGVLEEYTEDGVIKNGYSLQSILDDINTSSSLIGPGHITLKLGSDKTNVMKEDGYRIGQPMNLRSVMGGVEGSILDYYKGEYSFDKYNVTLHNEIGKDRGLTIRYGKNMTDLEQETGSNNTFTAIYPFYSKSYTVTNTTSKKVFQDTYIIDKITPLRSDWLSLSVGDFDKGFGIVALVPIVDYVQVIVDGITTTVARYVAVRIKTPGEYYDRLFAFKKNTVTNGDLINVYINNSIKNDDEETILELKLEDGTIITPKEQVIYIIKTEDSTFYNRKIIYDKDAYTAYNSDGFYMEVFDAAKVDPNTPLPSPLPVYKIRYDTNTETWVRDDINGKMYVEAQRPSVVTESENKYVYVDLKGYEPEEPKPTLDNGNLYVNAETQSLKSQRILTLDLTSALDDIGGLEPTQMTQKHVFDKAEQYLKDNDLTKIKESIKVSFIRLSDSPEYKQFKDLERVSLGDTVNVIYDKLGVSTKHRVIATEYDAINNSYVEIEIGDKIGTITDNVVSFGDNISDLKNDAQYTDKVYVTEFVAENASIVNAAIQNAIIETLQVSKINISGLLEASVATIDTLVAQLLTAENAVISDLLEAGSIRVKGNITALSGDIGGSKIQNGKLVLSTSIAIQSNGEVVNTHFLVDEKGNVLANSLSITGGDITIGNNFSVNNQGVLKAKQAEIEGDITGGSININDLFVVHPDGKVEVRSGEIEIGGSSNDSFKVDDSGNLIIGGDGVFQVSNDGKMIATEAVIYGDINADKIENIEKIVFKDQFTEIQPVVGSSTGENQTVNITTVSTSIEQPDGYEVWLNFYLNKPLWYPQVISVSYNYVVSKYGSSNNTVRRTKTFIIPAGVTSYTTFTGDYTLPHDNESIYSASASSYTPRYFDETRITSSEGYLGVDSNFAPLYNSGYSLGTSDSPWGDVYSDNEPIITSDKRSKKEINYDLEMYDKVYHSLKPVTYKKNNGKAGRKHLGLIAQDVKQVLDENNISTNDFAIFIASIKEDSKLKNKDDLTDDDINYGLRYSELHALHIRQIQLLKEEIRLLKEKINKN